MRISIIIFLFSIALSCQSPNLDCNNFRTGRYHVKVETESKIFETELLRMDSLEIDYYNGKADSAQIIWVSQCEYITRKIHPKSNSEKEALQMKIIKTYKDGYLFEFAPVGQLKNKKRGRATLLTNSSSRKL